MFSFVHCLLDRPFRALTTRGRDVQYLTVRSVTFGAERKPRPNQPGTVLRGPSQHNYFT